MRASYFSIDNIISALLPWDCAVIAAAVRPSEQVIQSRSLTLSMLVKSLQNQQHPLISMLGSKAYKEANL